MPEFPVQVTRVENGEYVASLVDLEDGPVGRGVDPYAAYKDLLEPALKRLRHLQESDSLPQASPANDRPVIVLNHARGDADVSDENTMQVDFCRVKQHNMICYTWTNDVTLI